MWGVPPYYNQQAFNPMQPINQFKDPSNTTVFVDGLSGSVTGDELRSFFQSFREITYVKILRSATAPGEDRHYSIIVCNLR
ncbi:hypothetical protein QBC38DRAFT_492009 [Podospora fimiseda]|uniref:RRM domain-containing protein n=1 Tax=Podospora fimiseda TaxID=252190 RepID=A0AAN6YLI5_9PEZI|nr:hypothetical protein QBC38DRAFT_492009 [Podospora fimiseda]